MGGIRLAGVLVTGLLLLAVLFMGDSGDEEVRPERGGTLTIALATEPGSLHGLTRDNETTALVASLMQAPLIRQHPVTRAVEPWLAERWDASADGRTLTLTLRRDLAWSDGTPFTSDDVRFTIETVLDPSVDTPLAARFTTRIGSAEVLTPHPFSAIVRMPADAAGGALTTVVDLPILPAHALRGARSDGRFDTVWAPGTPASAFAGMGPFVLHSREPGRIVLERNARYWRVDETGERLPYLDRVVLQVRQGGSHLVPIETGNVDLLGDPLPIEEYPDARQAERRGVATLLDRGVAIRPLAFWFCLSPAKDRDPRWAFVRQTEFRRALSHAVDREQFAQAVFFGQAVPVWGVVTPGSTRYFNPNVPRYPPDAALVGELMGHAGLRHRTGDGMLEHISGVVARFVAVAPEGGRMREAAAALTSSLAVAGVAVDVRFLTEADLDARLADCDYEMAIAPAPAALIQSGVNLEFWLSSGTAHVWHPGQSRPATDWEADVDALMVQYAEETSGEARRDLFHQAQRILGEQLPIVAVAAPREYLVHHPRVRGLDAGPGRPLLWNADSLHVADPRFVAAR